MHSAHFYIQLIIAIVGTGVVSKVLKWRIAYRSARATGYPVFLSLVHIRDMWWLVLHPMLLPILNQMPENWTQPWLWMGQVFSIWKIGYKPFAVVGSETFLLSSPEGNMLWTCDPQVCYQLENAYPKLEKAVDMLKFLDIWGPTVASVEGKTWKAHRRVVMSGFTPSTNATVWKESREQTKQLINRWSKDNNIIKQTRSWTKRLALHVIAKTFFRRSLTWSEDASSGDPIPPGHQTSFENALITILEKLGVLLMTPRFLLRSLPFKDVKDANLAFNEFTKYLRELIASSKAQSKSIVDAGSAPELLKGEPIFSEASVMGNTFFVLAAGHDTIGNTLSFAMDLLAVYPEYQVKIQEELDQAVAQRSADQWTVDREYAMFQDGWLGAFLKEVLRVYAVVQWLPRVVTAPIDVIDSKDQVHTIPKDTMCIFNFSAAFLNHKTWPTREISDSRRAELHNSPAAVDFDPSRWMKGGSGVEAENRARLSAQEAPLQFPFGQGVHVCPGRLFALVEMTSMLSTLLLEHRLELVVDNSNKGSYPNDADLAWEKTRDNAFRTLVDDIISNQNIELHKELPLRIVKRS